MTAVYFSIIIMLAGIFSLLFMIFNMMTIININLKGMRRGIDYIANDANLAASTTVKLCELSILQTKELQKINETTSENNS